MFVCLLLIYWSVCSLQYFFVSADSVLLHNFSTPHEMKKDRFFYQTSGTNMLLYDQQKDFGRRSTGQACSLCFEGENEEECVFLEEIDRCYYYDQTEKIMAVDLTTSDKNPALSLAVDTMMYSLMRKVSAETKWDQCVPFISEYTNCNKDNICTGCKQCNCDTSGKWVCREVHKCSRRSLKGVTREVLAKALAYFEKFDSIKERSKRDAISSMISDVLFKDSSKENSSTQDNKNDTILNGYNLDVSKEHKITNDRLILDLLPKSAMRGNIKHQPKTLPELNEESIDFTDLLSNLRSYEEESKNQLKPKLFEQHEVIHLIQELENVTYGNDIESGTTDIIDVEELKHNGVPLSLEKMKSDIDIDANLDNGIETSKIEKRNVINVSPNKTTTSNVPNSTTAAITLHHTDKVTTATATNKTTTAVTEEMPIIPRSSFQAEVLTPLHYIIEHNTVQLENNVTTSTSVPVTTSSAITLHPTEKATNVTVTSMTTSAATENTSMIPGSSLKPEVINPLHYITEEKKVELENHTKVTASTATASNKTTTAVTENTLIIPRSSFQAEVLALLHYIIEDKNVEIENLSKITATSATATKKMTTAVTEKTRTGVTEKMPMVPRSFFQAEIVTPLNYIIEDKIVELENLNKIKEKLLKYFGNYNETNSTPLYINTLSLNKLGMSPYDMEDMLRRNNLQLVEKLLLNIKKNIFAVLRDIVILQKKTQKPLPVELLFLFNSLRRYMAIAKNKKSKFIDQPLKKSVPYGLKKPQVNTENYYDISRRRESKIKHCCIRDRMSKIIEVINRDVSNNNPLIYLSRNTRKVIDRVLKFIEVENKPDIEFKGKDTTSLYNELKGFAVKSAIISEQLRIAKISYWPYKIRLAYLSISSEIEIARLLLKAGDLKDLRRLYPKERETKEFLGKIQGDINGLNSRVDAFYRNLRGGTSFQSPRVEISTQNASFLLQVQELLRSSKLGLMKLLHFIKNPRANPKLLNFKMRNKRSPIFNDRYKKRAKNILPKYLQGKVDLANLNNYGKNGGNYGKGFKINYQNMYFSNGQVNNTTTQHEPNNNVNLSQPLLHHYDFHNFVEVNQVTLRPTNRTIKSLLRSGRQRFSLKG